MDNREENKNNEYMKGAEYRVEFKKRLQVLEQGETRCIDLYNCRRDTKKVVYMNDTDKIFPKEEIGKRKEEEYIER